MEISDHMEKQGSPEHQQERPKQPQPTKRQLSKVAINYADHKTVDITLRWKTASLAWVQGNGPEIKILCRVAQTEAQWKLTSLLGKFYSTWAIRLLRLLPE